MNSRLDFSLVLPCYNEEPVFEKSLELIISALRGSRFSFEIVFVDDGSRDGTQTLIKKVCKKYSFCRFSFHKKNMGRGAAVTTGIRFSRGDVVGYMDIDCEVSPVYLPHMISLIKTGKTDIVVGKRIYTTSVTSVIREVLSVGYRMVVDMLFNVGGIDTESGYKFFNRKAFLPVLATIQNRGWFWDTESIVLSQRKGLTIVEVPVLFLRRFDKKSSVRLLSDIWGYIKGVWELFFRIRKS